MKENEIRFKEFFNESTIGMIYYDNTGKLIDINNSALEIMGIPSLEFFRDFNLFDDFNLPLKKEKLLKKGLIHFQAPLNFDNIKKMGHTPRRERSAFIDFTISTTDSGYLVQIQDITKQKNIEEQFKYQTLLLNNVNSPIIATDLNRIITSWNKAAEKLYGYKAEEAIGNVVSDIIKSEFTDKQRKKAIYCLSKGHKCSLDVKQYAKDGTPIYIEATNLPIYKEGEVIGFVSVNHDITKNKMIERELQESEEKFHIIFQSAPFSIALVRLNDSIIVDVNKQFTKLYGYTKEEAVGKTPVELRISRESKERERIYKELPKQKYTCNIISEVFDKSGTPFIGAANVGIIEINGVKYMLISSEDITEREKAENDLKAAHDNLELQVQERTKELEIVNKKLKTSNEELQRFMYIASHHLQEPLRTIVSFTQLLERHYKGKLDEDADEFISYVIEAAISIKQMINDLLEYSKVENGEKKYHVNLNEVLNEVIFDLNDIIERNNAEITYGSLPTIFGEENQLQRVFQYLITNAIKFRKEDESPRIHISATCDPEKNEYIFSIADNGIGIEKQYFSHIFTMFQRLHTQDEYQGTGTGLSLVKRIIEHHGGQTWVESEFGEGSVFYFTIPFERIK